MVKVFKKGNKEQKAFAESVAKTTSKLSKAGKNKVIGIFYGLTSRASAETKRIVQNNFEELIQIDEAKRCRKRRAVAAWSKLYLLGYSNYHFPSKRAMSPSHV